MKGEVICICSSCISSWCSPVWQTWVESPFCGECLGPTQRHKIKKALDLSTISCTATLRLFLLRENWTNIIRKVGKYLFTQVRWTDSQKAMLCSSTTLALSPEGTLHAWGTSEIWIFLYSNITWHKNIFNLRITFRFKWNDKINKSKTIK